ncbi:MAG TPA: orotidine-5'-phosphate decarboxylase [Burkholderiales bacterium]|nr:orotidine-5'-phosphate decarboxylase [Burkholderiales bacterium]
MTDPRLIVALDFPDASGALQLAARLEPAICRLKVGKELFTSEGPALVDELSRRGFQVFLDLKFHDIPNTVAQACMAAARLGVWMVNVHALGGRRMMAAAREALERGAVRPKLVAVTVLTSMEPADLAEVGVAGDPEAEVLRLAGLARDSGLDGVVCSAREAAMLHREIGRDFCLVTPGIRPAGAGLDDQSRVTTPVDAIRAGSDYLVVGRPITRAADPGAAARALAQEIDGALAGRAA